MSDKQITAEHLQKAIDTVLGLDPSQAPTDPAELNERLTLPQPGFADMLGLLSHQGGKHISMAVPLAFVLIEAANLADPENMEQQIKSKAYGTSIASCAAEAKAAIDGERSGAVRSRQPVLVEFLDKQLLAPESPAAKLSNDDRAGLYAMTLGTVHVIDRQLSGAQKPAVAQKLPGRNDPCHCGSGKKFKKCHGAPA